MASSIENKSSVVSQTGTNTQIDGDCLERLNEIGRIAIDKINDLEKRFVALEQRLMEKLEVVIEHKLKTMLSANSDLSDVREGSLLGNAQQMDNLARELEVNNKSITQLTDVFEIASSENFEQISFAWIQSFFEFDYPNIELESHKNFEDPKQIVDSKSDKFELDVYGNNPLMFCEVTQFFNEDKMEKLEKLLRVKDYFKYYLKHGNADEAKLFFIAYNIDSKLRDKAVEFCNKNNIKLIVKQEL